MISERSKRANIKELEIFDNFKVDQTLPKFVGQPVEDEKTGNTIWISPTTSDGTRLAPDGTSTNQGVWITANNSTPSENWGVPMSGGVSVDFDGNKNLNLFRRLRVAFTLKKRIEKAKAKKKKENLVTIRDYFINLAESFGELTPLADIADHYEKAILQAETLGQKALTEKLKDLLGVVHGEAHLIQMGVSLYVTNDQVCDFYESVDEDKNLKLTWMEHFVKIIPNEIVALKTEIDKRGVFDNYVILHYDPNGNATSLTKEEVEVKKDPILFGVIKNSKRLYYIGDWKDDYCDLTIEDMFEELGEKTLEINNRNLKTYINKTGDYEQKRKKVTKK